MNEKLHDLNQSHHLNALSLLCMKVTLISNNLPIHAACEQTAKKPRDHVNIITDKAVHYHLKSQGVLDSSRWSENIDAILLYHIKFKNRLTGLPEEEMKGSRGGRKGSTQGGKVEKRGKCSGRRKVGCYVLVFS
ncbi:hypothetical protein E3U43_017150 [Larimichthys crocea]|uniref:Uncharacterized protein n=1 Tax=Larimichthys crocea TaxID=215358 RepID=A0ACD3QYI5_LARCR|nr:hypothetical protein E3U43_017150 [Larimichthys crocea]